MLHVAILVHRHDAFRQIGYWLRALAEVWQENGVRVSVLHGPQARAEADIAILHVDLTVVPEEYLKFARQFPVVVNGGVPDISKRRVSQQLVRRANGYEGPVIVKSDRNFMGHPEAALSRRDAAGRWWKRPIKPVVDAYRIFNSAREVPGRVWKAPELVVEQFLPERWEGHYCVRTWLFFGDQERHTLFYATDPLVKSASIVGRKPLAEVPESIRQRRRDLKFDFGKFDYAVSDGRPVLFDANRTPTIGSFPREQYLPLVRVLAKGINAFRHAAIEPGR
ncbi:MAG TPA: hypothetical protein VIG03_07955 [Steroidobacteraceae bacterium]